MNNQDDLRTQILAAMNAHTLQMGWADRTPIFNMEMFDSAIMPVLAKAMEAGELLLHRNTAPPKPINDRIMDWLENSCLSITKVFEQEATVSKRMLLNFLAIMGDNAQKALADAREESDRRIDKGVHLPGLTTPRKG